VVAVKGGLRAGEIVELSIEKGVYRGLGLARHEGQVVFVPHALPGEQVRARVERLGRGFVNARLLSVVSPSAARREPPCPYVPRCGGCAYQELDYPGQLAVKADVLRDALARSGVKWDAEIPIQGSPEVGWRTRASFHVSGGPRELRLGLFEEGSHRVVDVETCLQVSTGMNRTARALLEGLRARPQWASAVRGIELAESGDGARCVACLRVQGDLGAASSLAALASDVPWLTGLGLTSEDGAAPYVGLSGDPHVETVVSGVALRSHVQSFFQGNRFLVEPLAQAALAALPSGGALLDLYSGVGLFSLLGAGRFDSVRAAEAGARAVEDARYNAGRAGIANVQVDAVDVGAALAAWPVAADERILLDPPRSGAGVSVVEAVVARQPRAVVYVSCDPPTLARDLQALLGRGYALQSLQALDLFPDTFHVETIAALAR
jgi:23S rRNA (uracil1939-C5)-methyltransferase